MVASVVDGEDISRMVNEVTRQRDTATRRPFGSGSSILAETAASFSFKPIFSLVPSGSESKAEVNEGNKETTELLPTTFDFRFSPDPSRDTAKTKSTDRFSRAAYHSSTKQVTTPTKHSTGLPALAHPVSFKFGNAERSVDTPWDSPPQPSEKGRGQMKTDHTSKSVHSSGKRVRQTQPDLETTQVATRGFTPQPSTNAFSEVAPRKTTQSLQSGVLQFSRAGRTDQHSSDLTMSTESHGLGARQTAKPKQSLQDQIDASARGIQALKVAGDASQRPSSSSGPSDADNYGETPVYSAGNSEQDDEDGEDDYEEDEEEQEESEDDEESSESDSDDSSRDAHGGKGMQLSYHSGLLHRPAREDNLNEIRTSPLFTEPVWKYAKSLSTLPQNSAFTQYALLGANSDASASGSAGNAAVFHNITAPSSIFICGNQGSGKSHSLSCLLENCLISSSKLGALPRPLTGLVFHYDTFTSDLGGTPCEAAYLASHPNVNVRVLCAPTNVRTIKHIYSRLPGVVVEELRLNDADLNTKRMLDLMAFGTGSAPLYMHILQRILRDMRIQQQATGQSFNYNTFKQQIEAENLTSFQMVPLQQRLDTLESFMVQRAPLSFSRKKTTKAPQGTDWVPKEGQLTIVDLSCPCVTPEMACSLFNICLSLFLEQRNPSIGRVVALDEAHKYMGESAEAQTLTNSLLSAIRLQRHLALRVIISTQEPTVSPKLLDLCSITIVHRFQSPDWLQVLKGHLAGLSTAAQILIQDEQSKTNSAKYDNKAVTTFDGVRGIPITPQNPALEMMSHIVKLKTGEALIFAPNAFVGVEQTCGENQGELISVPKRLDHEVMRVRIRARITADGGRSQMAN